ncbi:MAG TPA: hydroxymethylbilane synthase [Candidatus Omnitrophota bacterium]|nr:hydroxymethylbilane synthase [Candidatus Omnitrophota bacterium]
MKKTIWVGSRKSRLALRQAEAVLQRLRVQWSEIDFRLKGIVTEGDRDPVPGASGRDVSSAGLFTRGIEKALLDGRIDLAVHSAKDLPTKLLDGLSIGAVPERGETRDAWISSRGIFFRDLPPGAAVGTSSLRRKAQILSTGKDIRVISVRGNVDTRLRKLKEGISDGLILAACGLERLGLADAITELLDAGQFPPAAGQGALAVEIRAKDSFAFEMVRSLNHRDSFLSVQAERILLAELEGGCQVPLGISSRVSGGRLGIRAVLYSPDGLKRIEGEIEGEKDEAERLGKKLAERLIQNGGQAILREIRGRNG